MSGASPSIQFVICVRESLTEVTCAVQIYLFKPVQMSVSTVFLLLLIYSFGVAWAKYLPRKEWVEGTRCERFAGVIDFINPGEFRIKEVCDLLSGSLTVH